MNEPAGIFPLIASSLIAAAVVVVGWFVTSLLNRREARRLHKERRDDMQKAIYAEIRAFVALQERNQLAQYRDEVVRKIRDENFEPFFIEDHHDNVYQALIADTHYLPKETIDEITVYYQTLRQTREMQRAMKSTEYQALEPLRRALVYSDYIETIETAMRAGKAALTYIEIFDVGGKSGILEYKSKRAQRRAEEQKIEVKAWVNENR